MADDTSRKRTVRGRKIRSGRSQKEGRRAKKELTRTASAAREKNGDASLTDPEDVDTDHFTDLFTDVLAPNAAGEDVGSVGDLRRTIAEAL
ncbi:hypothetical protein [Natrarchaeobaculum sulfurireducens]|uniref:Gas vesicle protein GvpN n=1 Tax=Natrarchaeobaculum sulfurireducens TaxID=2044521 RepID=A0A346PRH4_9EURY|nr:Gas vesicle synthesis protein GvpN [Natrarchaeobaculum sulfurireducens]AXR82119.1 Gas vesicle protein GvpN [Natrarchaeobaculum sulfurireducens]